MFKYLPVHHHVRAGSVSPSSKPFHVHLNHSVKCIVELYSVCQYGISLVYVTDPNEKCFTSCTIFWFLLSRQPSCQVPVRQKNAQLGQNIPRSF